MKTQKIIPNATRRDYVLNALRTEIIHGKLPLGSRLTPPLLAKRLGVSVGTVQLAVNHLAREEFVEIVPRKGTFVVNQFPYSRNYGMVFWNDPTSPDAWSKYYAALTNEALALQRRRDAHQRFHQRGRKRVDLPELLQVALLREQDLLDGFLDLFNGLERLPDQFGRRAVLRHQ